MKHDISTLIRRSKERSAVLSHRIPTREEIRWGARLALNGMTESDLAPPRWWQLPGRSHRFSLRRCPLPGWPGSDPVPLNPDHRIRLNPDACSHELINESMTE